MKPKIKIKPNFQLVHKPWFTVFNSFNIRIDITFTKLSAKKAAQTSYPFRKLSMKLLYLCSNITNVPFHSLNFRVNFIRRGHFTVLEASIVASCIGAERNRADDQEIVALSQNIHLKSSVLRWQEELRQYWVPVKMPFTVDRPISVVFINFAFPAQFCQSRAQISTSVVTVNNNRYCFPLEHQLSPTLST